MHRSFYVTKCYAAVFVMLVSSLVGCSGGSDASEPRAPTPNVSAPSVTTISPNRAMAGSAAFTLTVNGANFVSESTVNFDGTPRPTTLVSALQLTAAIPASAIASAGTVAVSVTNSAPRGSSNAVSFTISGGTNPVPVISVLSPSGAPAGAGAFSLWISGSNFVAGSIVRWNGSDRATSFVDADDLEAQISATDVGAAGTAVITVFNPAPGGGPSNTADFPISEGGASPMSIAIDPTGRFAYVANLGVSPDVWIGDVSMFAVDVDTGLLTRMVPRVSAEHGPTAVTVHPSGKFVYVANQGDQGGGEDVGDVSIYSVDTTTGALTPTETVNGVCPSLCVPYGIAVDPTGNFAYVPSEGGPSPTTISMYSINAASGALTLIGTVGSGGRAIAVTVDSSGKYVYAVDGEDNAVAMFTVNGTSGALTPMGTLGAGATPYAITVDPSGKFVYVANSTCDNISMYSVSATTGALTSMGVATAGSSPRSIAVDPTSRFAYATNFGSNDVAMYTINASSGTLTFEGTVAAGACPVSVAIHSSGRFAYVTNNCSNDISIYSIDGTTGTLTPIGSIGT